MCPSVFAVVTKLYVSLSEPASNWRQGNKSWGCVRPRQNLVYRIQPSTTFVVPIF